jgi:hypothetical protein
MSRQDRAFDRDQLKIKNSICSNSTLVLTSDTGLGKTTRVPLYMAELFTRKGLNHELQIKKIQEFDTDTDDWIDSNINSYNNPPNNTENDGMPFMVPDIDDNSIIICCQPKEVLAQEHGGPDSHLKRAIRYKDESVYDSTDLIEFKGKNSPKGTPFGKAITFVTSGWLAKHMISNPYLNSNVCNVSCVIVDEAHERSLDIDMVMGLLKQIVLVRPNFKIVIMSATIDNTLFTNYFYNAKHLHITNSYQNEANQNEANPNVVTINYLNKPSFNPIYSAIGKLNYIINVKRDGDIIVFVPSSTEALTIINWLQLSKNVENYDIIYVASGVMKDYLTKGQDPSTDQVRQQDKFVLRTDEKCTIIKEDVIHNSLDVKHFTTKRYDNPSAKPLIIFSTNALESSVTIPKLKYVIDMGLTFESSYNAKSDMSFLSIHPITKDSANQRKGRVGRKSPGTCYRLYTEEVFETYMKPNATPAIFNINIESTFIDLLSRGINFLNFDFIEPPLMEQTLYTMKKLEIYGIIPNDFNILTDVSKMDQSFINKALLYNELSYIKYADNKSLSLDPILIHIILDGLNNGHEFLKMIIITSINYNAESTDGRHKNSYLLSNVQNSSEGGMDKTDCDFISYYNIYNTYNFINGYNDLLQAIVKILSNRGVIGAGFNSAVFNSAVAITSINATLKKHGHICYIDYASYKIPDQETYEITYKIDKKKSGLNIPDIDDRLNQRYTYVFSTLRNNKFSYRLLTKLDN